MNKLKITICMLWVIGCISLAYIIIAICNIVHEYGHYITAIVLGYECEIYFEGITGRNYCITYNLNNDKHEALILVMPLFSCFVYTIIIDFLSYKMKENYKYYKLTMLSFSTSCNIGNVFINFMSGLSRSDGYKFLQITEMNLVYYSIMCISIIFIEIILTILLYYKMVKNI